MGSTPAGRSTRQRLDILVVERGLAATRERARALILAGQVSVDGQIVSKAGAAVASDTARDAQDAGSSVCRPRRGQTGPRARRISGRSRAGRRTLDIGASTGGFTDVLLQRDAASVIAVDVGRGQLDWRLRNDPRVIVLEGINARGLSVADLPHRVTLVTIDVAFISLRHILPVLPRILEPPADVVALVKPQFEAGRTEVGKHGLVTDPAVHEAVLARVTAAAAAVGLSRLGMTPSPITGATGNQEFFLHLR